MVNIFNDLKSLDSVFSVLGGVWYIRVKLLCFPKKVMHVVESTCMPYSSPLDLQFKLRKVDTRHILLYPEYVLSLVVPFDKRPVWDESTKLASSLRNIPSDYRFSMLKYRSINQRNYSTRYSYVSFKNFRAYILSNV